MTTERECPECGEYTKMDNDAKSFECKNCLQQWRINYDSDYQEGRYIDCTTLSPL